MEGVALLEVEGHAAGADIARHVRQEALLRARDQQGVARDIRGGRADLDAVAVPVVARRGRAAHLDGITQIPVRQGAAKRLHLLAFNAVQAFLHQIKTHQQAGQLRLVDGTERGLITAAPGQQQLARRLEMRHLARQPPGQGLQARLAPVFLRLLAGLAPALALQQAARAHFCHQMHGPRRILARRLEHLFRNGRRHLRLEHAGPRGGRQRKRQRAVVRARRRAQARQGKCQQAGQQRTPADQVRTQNRVSRAARKKLSRMGVQSSSSTPPAEWNSGCHCKPMTKRARW